MHFCRDLETTSFPVYFLNKTLDDLVSFLMNGIMLLRWNVLTFGVKKVP